MSELFDFGRHGPYILAAYAASLGVLAAMIYWARRRLKRSIEAERVHEIEK